MIDRLIDRYKWFDAEPRSMSSVWSVYGNDSNFALLSACREVAEDVAAILNARLRIQAVLADHDDGEISPDAALAAIREFLKPRP